MEKKPTEYRILRVLLDFGCSIACIKNQQLSQAGKKRTIGIGYLESSLLLRFYIEKEQRFEVARPAASMSSVIYPLGKASDEPPLLAFASTLFHIHLLPPEVGVLKNWPAEAAPEPEVKNGVGIRMGEVALPGSQLI